MELLNNMDLDDLNPMRWEHFRSSPINESGSDEEAMAMFHDAQCEVAARDWCWYRRHYGTDDEAQAAWRHQRLRYGLPVD